MSIIFYIFIIITAAVVILNEKFENLVLRKFFRKYIEELEIMEEKLAEYQYLSILAIAAKDKEAYRGFQILMNDIYWPLFFRKMVFTTSLYFLLLTPYMVITQYLLNVSSAISLTIFVAIVYFTIKLGYGLIRNFIDAWKAAKVAKENIQYLDENEKAK